jgi:3-hydroxy-3-methylglutaryl CoA synthase
VSGIVGAAGYIPYRRLDRATIRAVAGGGGGKGHRAVASYDEDATTMAFEAARGALVAAGGAQPDLLLDATTTPPYLDKTNATTIHAALRLPPTCGAWDAGASVRSAVGAIRLALERPGTTLVTAADLRTGQPGGADEAAGGDAAAALVVGDGAVVADYLGGTTVAAEFIDRWRPAGQSWSRSWEERFGEGRYIAAGKQAWAGLDLAAHGAGGVDRVVVAGTHARARAAMAKALAAVAPVADDLAARVGNPGAAQPALLLTAALEAAAPGEVIALVVLADGADVLLFRTTELLAERRASRSIAEQVATGGEVPYGRFLTWRGFLAPEPPNRPEPARVSAPAAARNEEWKHGLVDADKHTYADACGRIATFTVDRLAWSPSPPVVFAVVDFEGGGRLPVELTDVDESEVAIGAEVEMVFRRLGTADGIHNYFWKARPRRRGPGDTVPVEVGSD